MRKLKYIVLVLFFASSLLFFEDCDVASNPVNIKVTIPINFSESTTSTTISDPQTFKLSDSKEWNDAQEEGVEVSSVKFFEASYWTVSNPSNSSPSPDLQGDLTFSLFFQALPLGSVSESKISPELYLEAPYKFIFTPSEITAINNVLSQSINNDNIEFNSVLDLTVLVPPSNTNSNGEYALDGKVVIVLDVNLTYN